MLVSYSEYRGACYQDIKDTTPVFICPVHDEIHFQAIYLDIFALLISSVV
jgi:hypothetical protein